MFPDIDVRGVELGWVSNPTAHETYEPHERGAKLSVVSFRANLGKMEPEEASGLCSLPARAVLVSGVLRNSAPIGSDAYLNIGVAEKITWSYRASLDELEQGLADDKGRTLPVTLEPKANAFNGREQWSPQQPSWQGVCGVSGGWASCQFTAPALVHEEFTVSAQVKGARIPKGFTLSGYFQFIQA